jgi:hypothetical protein
MSIPDWPATLPQNILIPGYGESLPDTNVKASMDVGPAKVRRRATAAVRPVSGQLVLTLAQLGDFKDFYNDDLLNGSLRFAWVDPYDGTTAVEMRFTEVPSWSAQDPDNFVVNVKLEILP